MFYVNVFISWLTRLLPRRSAWIEASGYLLLGAGIFLGLACYTYDQHDYFGSMVRGNNVRNLAGPLGAQVAFLTLGYFGVVGILWPIVMITWGSLVAFGFVTAPKLRRLVGLAIAMVVLSAIAEIQLAAWGLSEPIFGYGGHIGVGISVPLLEKLGYGGSLTALLVFLFATLSLSGNLALSQTAPLLKMVLYTLFKFARGLWRKFSEKTVSDEQLVKEALAKVALASAQKKGEIGPEITSADVLAAMSPSEAPVGRKRGGSAAGAKVSAAPGSNQPGGDVNGEPQLNLYYDGPAHGKPGSSMFTRSQPAPKRKDTFEKMAKKLTAQLAQFKVEGKVVNIIEGPVVTTCEFEPSPGTKVSKITSLAEDLARLLEAKTLRILAPIPGKNTVGFEVPNAERRTIGFADLIETKNFKSTKINLPIAMGVDAFGKPVVEDLTKMPHLLVAGSTGSGKSVFMNTLIAGLIARHTAKDLRFIMVDPKMVELAAYNKLPHMACPVVIDPTGDAKQKLDALVAEMEDRFRRMGLVGARNIDGFNDTIRTRKKSEFLQFEGKWQAMPYVVLIIDELADMMMVLGREAEIPITRLAQKARAAGIHLVIATQRPSAEVVTGLIKANFPTRVAFRVLSGIDSRTILDTSGAETLLGQGDMLFLNAAGLRRMHGAYLSDKEVASMVKATGRGK